MTTRRRNSTSRIERGDFQTPPALAEAVCRRLAADGIAPRAVLEPGCGTGAFVRAALDAFPTLQAVLALDVSGEHLAQARHAIRDARVTWAEADLFRTDLRAAVASLPDPLLVLGNPPWVTTAEIGRLAGSNRPARDGRRGVPGVGAITGSSNFDVSEWIARACLDALAGRDGVLALLVKTPVARRLVTAGAGAGSARMARIDAARAFGVQVGAALLVMRDGDPRGGCPVYDSLEDGAPCQTLALRGGRLVADLARWTPHAHLEADAPGVAWRSGVKHDCAPVLELRGAPGAWRNGLGEDVDVETECVYPLRKGADVGHERPTDRWVLIPQRSTGEDPARLREAAPRTWRYLCRHAERLDGRRSRI